MDGDESIVLFWLRSSWRSVCLAAERLSLAVSFPFRWLGGHLAPFFQHLDAGLIQGLTLLGSWIGIVLDAVRDNLQVQLFLQGLPALLVGGLGLTTLAAACWDRSWNRSADRLEMYRRQGAESFAGNNLDRAHICYQRLAQMGELDPDQRYRAALVCQAQAEADADAADREFRTGRHVRANELFENAWEKSGQAAAMMRQLASLDQPGYPPAHVWWADQLLARSGPAGTEPAERHLRLALQARPDDLAAHALLGQLYLKSKRPELAEPHLQAALTSRPELHLSLARMYQAAHRPEPTKSHALRAVSFFRTASEANLDDHGARIGWAASLLLLGQFPDAAAVLEEGLRLTKAPVYRSPLARCYVLWSDGLTQADKAADAAGQSPDFIGRLDYRLTLLERAMQFDLTQVEPLRRLANLTRQDSPARDEQMRAALRSLLAAGRHPATVHLAFMLDEQASGRPIEARRHRDAAARLMPALPSTINNLAWSLAFDAEPNLSQALELIDWAIERQPTDLNFRETRGQILARMGRWKQALPELQAGFAVRRYDPLLHEALARTYLELGDATRAALHQQQANFLTRMQNAPRSLSRASEILSSP